MGRIWDDVIGEEERALYERAGYGRPAGFGARPALLLVDLYVTDVDAREGSRFRDPLPRALSSTFLPSSACSKPVAPRGAGLLLHEPVSRRRPRHDRVEAQELAGGEPRRALDGRPVPFMPAVAPRPDDWIIYKQRPSAFFGTQLVGYLIGLQIDTLLVGGQSTSGCVRATVLDAFSYGFRTAVVEECTFDRGTVSHKVNLFDMHQKYADVTPLSEVLDYLRRLACSGSSASS